MSPHASTQSPAAVTPFTAHCAEASSAAGDSACLFQGTAQSYMTDDEREAAIKRAAAAMEKHYAEWLVSGCFAAKGDADRAMRLMYLLIQGRSAAQVAALEAERGLGPVAVEVQERAV